MEDRQNIKISRLFLSFMKIGIFTFGGGYAMIPLIEREIIDKRKWVDRGEFFDLLTIAQSVPGPIALNSAAFVGYKTKGYKGALASVGGVVLPSFVILLAVALFFATIRDNAVVVAAFNGMRPAVVALMTVPMFTLMRGEHPSMMVITAITTFVMWWFNISPIYMIAAAVVFGVVWTYRVKRRVEK
ncbi:MAG: chromate transporter [Rikenellaceae bacterium]